MIAQKGGTGKTTLSIHLAVVAEQYGRQVALVDLDPQASAAEWHHGRTADTPLLARATASDLPEVLQECEDAGIDIVIVDTAPHSNEEAARAASSSDFVVIPCRPTILDLRAIAPSIDIAAATKRRAAVVINSAPPRTGIAETRIVSEARDAIERYDVECWDGQVTQRAAFSHALIDGRAVTEFEPGGKAALEIERLWSWLSERRFGMMRGAA